MLKIANLSKRYGNGVQALDNVSLDIPKGMFGLIGPNGAGKSTLMRTLATLQDADEGSIFLGEIDVLRSKEQVRRSLGYLPQDVEFYPNVSAETMLDHFAILKGIVSRAERRDTVERLLRLTNLHEARKRKLGSYSGGMRRRFGIAQALLGNPELIIVDEPTAGLDPEERVRFQNLLCEVAQRAIVILSTHIIEDVRELCPEFAVLSHGRILRRGPPADAIAAYAGRVWRKCVPREETARYLAALPVLFTRFAAGLIAIDVLGDDCPGDGFEPIEPDLEHAYFATLHA